MGQEDHLESEEEQRNVTKDMDSFDPKLAQAELSTTLMDLTTIGMTPCPRTNKGVKKRTHEDLTATHESKRVDDINHTETTAVTHDGSRDI